MEKVLGDDEVNNNLVMYLDDLVHLSTFSENLQDDARIGGSDACKEEVDVWERRYVKEKKAVETVQRKRR